MSLCGRRPSSATWQAVLVRDVLASSTVPAYWCLVATVAPVAPRAFATLVWSMAQQMAAMVGVVVM
jgi:hypothetical protein